MTNTDLYKLNLKSLSQGKHSFSYELDDSYFAGIESDEIHGGEVHVTVSLEKNGEVHKLELSYDGYVVVNCDRCLEPMELDAYDTYEMVVKFGSEYSEEDEVLILPEREGVLDLHWHLYEDIALSLPMQRMHEEGECDSSMMNLYGQLSTNEIREASEESKQDIARDEDGIDQRWAALKKLKK
ncbi:MAG: DUF177 domain-containing protein [Porphyromonadaceae bacterium]|nr:DUF177 domain-containing protein [Porphyromonadaceae bacterium]